MGESSLIFIVVMSWSDVLLSLLCQTAHYSLGKGAKEEAGLGTVVAGRHCVRSSEGGSRTLVEPFRQALLGATAASIEGQSKVESGAASAVGAEQTVATATSVAMAPPMESPAAGVVVLAVEPTGEKRAEVDASMGCTVREAQAE